MLDLIKIEQKDGINVVSSRLVAEKFRKRHSDVTRAIEEKIKTLTTEFYGVKNLFIESSYNHRGNDYKEYLLTRDGFSFIVMGFTGSEADKWKLQFIDAFNKMEQQITQMSKKQELLLGLFSNDPIIVANSHKQLVQLETQPLVEKIETDKPYVELAKKRLDSNGLISITDATKTFELKRGKITKWAKNEGYLHKNNTEVNVKGEKYFKVYDAKGYRCIGINENGLVLISENLDEIKNI